MGNTLLSNELMMNVLLCFWGGMETAFNNGNK